MRIMSRMTRMFKADVHGAMDQMEDRGLIFKQCLREMEEALAARRAELGRLDSEIAATRREVADLSGRLDHLEADIRMAVEKGRDDIARFLIKKAIPLRLHKERLIAHEDSLAAEIAEGKETLADRERRYESVKLRGWRYLRKPASDGAGEAAAGRRREGRRGPEGIGREWDAAVFADGADMVDPFYDGHAHDPGGSDHEVELELLRRKEKLDIAKEKSGAAKEKLDTAKEKSDAAKEKQDNANEKSDAVKEKGGAL